jgi:hypothetical protein
MKNDFTCKTRAAALSALEAIAENTPPGTQRLALLAVKGWIEENTQPERSWPEVTAKLKKIFEGDEHDQLGRAWSENGGVPAHGARVHCIWNSRTKKWEPEHDPEKVLSRKKRNEEDVCL